MAATRKRKKAGSMEEVRRLLWQALTRAAGLLEVEDPETGQPDNALALKAIHAISQGAGAYAKVTEVTDLAARIEALEAAKEEGETGPRLSKVGA